MTHAINRESTKAAIKALIERGWPKGLAASDIELAITAFLSAERARGVELRPREPSAEMVVSGIAERHGQPVPEAWSLATENIWRAMWDAGAQK